MPIKDFMTITTMQVKREVNTPDGMGGLTTVATLTNLSKAALWSPSQSARYISEKMARTSSHILITDPNEYTFNMNDDSILYNGNEYEINGPSDNIMELGEILITPLNRIQ